MIHLWISLSSNHPVHDCFFGPPWPCFLPFRCQWWFTLWMYIPFIPGFVSIPLFFIYFLVYFLFSDILLWVFHPFDTLTLIWSTCLFPFYNLPNLFALAPNVRHILRGSTSILSLKQSCIPFLCFLWQLSRWAHVSCQSAGVTAQKTLFNCRLICILRLLQVFA